MAECPRGVCLDLNAYEDFGGGAPCTCMRATRIAMVSYFQVTLWRGFMRVMSLIGVRPGEDGCFDSLKTLPIANILNHGQGLFLKKFA